MSFINDSTNQGTLLLNHVIEEAADAPSAPTKMTIHQMFGADLSRVCFCESPTLTPENSFSERAIQKLEEKQEKELATGFDEIVRNTNKKTNKQPSKAPRVYSSQVDYSSIEYHMQTETKPAKPVKTDFPETTYNACLLLIGAIGDTAATTPETSEKTKNKFMAFLSSFSFKAFINNILDWFKKPAPYDIQKAIQEGDEKDKKNDPHTVTITKTSRYVAEFLEDGFNEQDFNEQQDLRDITKDPYAVTITKKSREVASFLEQGFDL